MNKFLLKFNIDIPVGMSIIDVLEESSRISKTIGCAISFIFNDYRFLIDPETDIREKHDQYWDNIAREQED